MSRGKHLLEMSIVTVLLALCGCDKKPEPPPALPKTEEAPRIFAPQHDALDRARQVEGQVQEDANKRQEAIDAQTR